MPIDTVAASRDRLKSKKTGGVGGVGAERGDADLSKEKFTSGLSSGKATGGSGVGMPKQSDFNGDNAAWQEAVRKWREKNRSGATMDHAASALANRR
jgi:hypothetical protein